MSATLAIQGVAAIVLALLVVSAVTDWRSRIVPNAVPIAILAVIVVAIALLPGLRADAASRGAALIVMVVSGTVLGAARVLGGGDIKLLAALAPWHGLAALPTALLCIGAAGGVLAIGFILAAALSGKGWREGLKSRVPYAIAILAGEAALAAPLFFATA